MARNLLILASKEFKALNTQECLQVETTRLSLLAFPLLLERLNNRMSINPFIAGSTDEERGAQRRG